MMEENDYGKTVDEPQRKKRKRTTNPLSQARGKKSHANVWFRRTNAGYSLFVQYYMGQPNGTVSNISKEDPNKVQELHIQSTKKPTGAGMSRAAKRRNKKKRQQETEKSTSETTTDHVDHFLTSKTNPPSLLVSEYTKLEKKRSNNFEAFLSAMSRPLPLSFRIRKYDHINDATNAVAEINEQFSALVEDVPFGNTTLYRARTENSSSDVVLSKESLNKISPQLKEYLVQSSNSGVLARQEIGSMLPVIALNTVNSITAGSRVLDMCASPGSKTLQALEIVGKKGRVVANDVSEARLDALRGALERSGVSPTLLKRIHYSCQDGCLLQPPRLKAKSPEEKGKRLDFHAVICDVPCSGDGTIRKDRHILPSFQPNVGNELHSLQTRILLRALQLVKRGGVVCYSTCTLNPVEDEAVVAAALLSIQKGKDDKRVVELVDMPTLPGDLIGRPGISNWRVAEYQEGNEMTNDDDEEIPNLSWYDSFKDAQADEKFSPSMWPPSSSENQHLHLERCVRLWPQDRDTGGFFLALIRKNYEF